MTVGVFKGSNLKIRQQTWHHPPLGETQISERLNNFNKTLYITMRLLVKSNYNHAYFLQITIFCIFHFTIYIVNQALKKISKKKLSRDNSFEVCDLTIKNRPKRTIAFKARHNNYVSLCADDCLFNGQFVNYRNESQRISFTANNICLSKNY